MMGTDTLFPFASSKLGTRSLSTLLPFSAVFTCAPTWVASERCVAKPSETLEGAPVDVSKTVPGMSVADWLLLRSAPYDRLPELAIELAERGGIDIE